MSGEIKFSVGSNLVRCLECNDLATYKKFALLLGSDPYVLSYSLPDSQLIVPMKIKTDGGFIIWINQLRLCDFDHDVILCSQPIDWNLHLIKNLKSPFSKFVAVNNAYAAGIQYKTTIGNIPNTVTIGHTLFTFPAAKGFTSGKIIICEM